MGDPEFSAPRYRPDLNEGLGGSIELGDSYLFPVELPARDVRDILDQQAGDDATIKGSQFPFFSLEISQDQQYDLLHTDGEDHPVDAIARYNPDEEEVVGFDDVDDLTG